jgi:hypothetical protein
MLGVPSGPGEEDWMTVTFKLERLDGTPAEPPSIETTVLAWSPGATIPLSAGRTLQVVRRNHDDEHPVLVVEDLKSAGFRRAFGEGSPWPLRGGRD